MGHLKQHRAIVATADLSWAAVAIVVLTGIALETFAQGSTEFSSPWHYSLEQPFVSSITPTMIDEFIVQLQLDETQAGLARHFHTEHAKQMEELRTLHDKEVDTATYHETLRAAYKVKGVEARIEALVPLAEREEKIAAIADEQAALDETLLAQLKLLLSEEQQEHWPHFVEWLNRERYGGHGGYPGDHIHLFTILEPMQLTDEDLFIPAEEFERFLQRYSRELNAVLVERRQHQIDDARNTIRRVHGLLRANQSVKVYDADGNYIDVASADPQFHEDLKKRQRDGMEIARRLHRLQVQYRAALTGKFAPHRLKEFHDRFYELVIQRPPPRAESWINSLLAVEELDENRQVTLEQMLGELMRRWRELAIDEYQLRQRRAELRFETGDRVPGVNDPKMLELNELQDREHALMDERSSLDNEIMHRAWNLFSPEERELLPQPPLWRTG